MPSPEAGDARRSENSYQMTGYDLANDQSAFSVRNLRDTVATPWLLLSHGSRTTTVVLSACCKGVNSGQLRYAEVETRSRSSCTTWHGSEIPKL